MKIYEITTRTPNEQLINSELIRLSKVINEATTAPAVIEGPGFFSKAGAAFMSIIKTAGWFFLLKPFYTFYKNMSVADDNLKADQSPNAQERYNEELVIQVGLLVSGIAAGLITKGIFGTVTALLGFIKYVPFVGPIIAKTINLLSAGAQVYVLRELSSEEGRTAIAKLLTGTILGQEINAVKGIGTGATEAVKYFAKVINDALNHEKSADETPKDAEPEKSADSTSKKPDEKSPTPANKETDPATKPIAKDPNALDWTPKAGEKVYTPSNMGRSASGRLTL